MAVQTIKKVIALLQKNKKAVMSTAACSVPTQALASEHVVKVFMDSSGKAVSFSRKLNGSNPLKHLGIYGYHKDFLLKFTQLSPSPSEKKWKLEQLRALDYGYPIHVALVDHNSVAVDVPEDIQKVESVLVANGLDLASTRGANRGGGDEWLNISS